MKIAIQCLTRRHKDSFAGALASNITAMTSLYAFFIIKAVCTEYGHSSVDDEKTKYCKYEQFRT